jgi:hypothetical protein
MAKPKPTQDQIKAVQAVLYKPQQVRQLRAHASSINVLMNIDNPNGPDKGPPWTIQATGQPSSRVIEAIARCRKIAESMRTMSRQLEALALPTAHRRDLRTGLTELAATWDARAAAWEAPGKPDVQALVGRISAHQKASAKALARVSAYLRTAESLGG